MILDVILGYTIDTSMWINDLLEQEADHIVVLDYDYYGEPKMIDKILYLSAIDTKNYINKFDSVNYYKSLYAFPGMSGNMSSLFKS